MNATAFLEQFEHLADAPNGIAKLRQLILQLAVRGKLVPQDPDDEPASELLKKIRAERQRLIAEGVIRKTKSLPSIEQEELPYEVPDGWAWARIADIGVVGSSSRVHQRDWQADGIPFYRAREIVKLSKFGVVENELFISEELYETLSRKGYLPEADDLMLTGVGTIGVPYVVSATDRFYFKDASVLIFKNILRITPQYLRWFFESDQWKSSIHRDSMGTTVHTLTISRASLALLPLPPLTEQKRIVAKVDQLMTLCDGLETKQQGVRTKRIALNRASLHALTEPNGTSLAPSWHRVRDHFDHLYTIPETVADLRQTILQLAVMGRLVPQDPNDEPASELLNKIQAEKQRLITEGVIRKSTPVPPIEQDALPFDLPQGWAWARFPELGEFGRGRSKHRPRNDPILYREGTYPVVQTGDVAQANGVIDTYTGLYNDVGLEQSKLWPEGTLCITIAANIADTAVLGFEACFPDSVVGFIPASCLGHARYFEYFMRTAQSMLQRFAPSTAQKNINLSILRRVAIPLPPHPEIGRIVAKVDQLMTLCDDLEARLQQTQTDADNLLTAIVHKLTSPTTEGN